MSELDPKALEAALQAHYGDMSPMAAFDLVEIGKMTRAITAYLAVTAETTALEDAAKIADKVAEEYAGADEGTFRAGVRRAAIMIARRIRSKQIPYYGSQP